MQTLSLTNDYTQKFSTVLNNQQVDIRIWYQDISDGWYFSMSFTGGANIVSGFRINTGSPILTSIFTSFTGNIICVSSADKYGEPGKIDPWGETHNLVYLTSEESKEFGLEPV